MRSSNGSHLALAKQGEYYRRVRLFASLTIAQASRTARETEKQLLKEARVARTAASQIKKELHRAGVEARK